ncbi:MFS transporter [Corynebacterium freneyi]|uniref:MFS transporter n=1 Tax=Corynebacterium freneyi TaxID=134034 RepID=UPI00254ACC07|nr:aromatic acid/H+ symport family MFS transporter [Corynebacterium freneyi]MDK8768195.1 aromatic acid/H+ symport family MFS transporter [Corynebacterium freneyi]
MTPTTTGTTAARTAPGPWASPTHRRSVLLVLAIVAIAILFDGYDLVIYGAVLPTLLADPSQIGALTPETAGTLGAWALIGVLVGALTAGAVGDRFGRKRVMLAASVWFSAGMAATALTTSATTFGFFRFLTGVGVGMIVATGGAIIAEFAPRGRKNLFNAIVYSGVPAGGVLASVLAILLLDAIGWRGLFLIGATPLLFLVPMIVVALPESPRWLVSVGRTEEALAVCERHGLPQADFIPAASANTASAHDATNATPAPAPAEKVGYAALFSRTYAMGAILIGFMSFTGLLLTYGLNTWLPKIMENAGGQAKGSLLFLVVLNGGAIAGGLAASWLADRIGAKRVVAATFLIAALCLVALPMNLPLGVLYAAVAIAGFGTIGTQVLVYGLTANYFGTEARAAGVAWCAGFGRIGGILGPVIGGVIIGAGLSSGSALYIFAGLALVGSVLTALVPRSPAQEQRIELLPETERATESTPVAATK